MGKRALKYAEAPALDLSRTDHRTMEASGVVENVVGSIIGSVRRELQGKRSPTAAGYTKILLADLRARGFDIVEMK